jgi:glyoxylase I family protein
MQGATAPSGLPALPLGGIHHVAIIASDYERSCRFYTEVLGLIVVNEVFRAERQSYKLDLQLPDGTQIELFSFPSPPARLSYPEACGLRHLALRVADIDASLQVLALHGVAAEPVRMDPFTGAPFTFLEDPDGLPIELVGPAPFGVRSRAA